jgi:dTDP-glucose 4,6-dehydratase
LDELRPNIDTSYKASDSFRKLIRFVKDRPGHDRRYAIDPYKIELELDWKPKETFETGLRKTVTWYLNNRDWCNFVQKGNYTRERLGNIKK